jgi:hypothetical protein
LPRFPGSSCCNRRPVFGLPRRPRPLCSTLRQGSESPRLPTSKCASRLVPQVTLASTVVRLCQPVDRRVASSVHPSALPCLNLRVAPFPRSSGNAYDRFPPDFSGSPRSSGSAEVRLPGSPRFLALPATPLAGYQGYPCGSSPIAALRRCRCCAFSGFPSPCTSTAKSMMTPRIDSNFASAACAVDESSSQSGLAHPRLALLMHSPNSISIFHSPGCPDSFPT